MQVGAGSWMQVVEPGWHLREMREGVERGENGADPWSQWLPARLIWLGKGIQSL